MLDIRYGMSRLDKVMTIPMTRGFMPLDFNYGKKS